MMKNLRKKVYGFRQKLRLRVFAARSAVIMVIFGIIMPVLAGGTTAMATDVNDSLGFGKKIDPVKTLKNVGSIAINIASAIAVAAGVVFLIQGIQAFFQARDSHDSQQMMQGFSRLFIGIGMAAAGGIAFFFVGQTK